MLDEGHLHSCKQNTHGATALKPRVSSPPPHLHLPPRHPYLAYLHTPQDAHHRYPSRIPTAGPSQPCRLQPPSSTSSPKTVRPFSAQPRPTTAPLSLLTPFAEKGNEYPLADLKGKVVLVVNTASKCGFTPQFEGLEKLYKEVSASHPDFTILGFPCNQFGGQDPGTNDEIQSFCQVNYGVTFPVLGKVDVNGDKADPVFEWLKTEKPGLMGLKRVKWNFEKFLIGRDGKVLQRWASTTKPEALKADIEKALAAK